MSMLPPVSRSPRQSGFTLVEVLAAIMVAGLVLSALARAFQTARSATKTPAEIVSAVSIAESVALAGPPDALPDGGRIGRFAYERRIGSLEITARRADVAPSAVVDNPQSPAGLDLRLRRVSVLVTAPSGRRIAFETVRLENAAR